MIELFPTEPYAQYHSVGRWSCKTFPHPCARRVPRSLQHQHSPKSPIIPFAGVKSLCNTPRACTLATVSRTLWQASSNRREDPAVRRCPRAFGGCHSVDLLPLHLEVGIEGLARPSRMVSQSVQRRGVRGHRLAPCLDAGAGRLSGLQRRISRAAPPGWPWEHAGL